MTDQLDQLQAALGGVEQHKFPPVHLWIPPLSGDIDIRIDREGRWFHECEPILRPQLVKLFASILKKEGDEHYLVTPVEKWRIKVDVAPLFVVTARCENSSILLGTTTGDEFTIGLSHPLRLIKDCDGLDLPVVEARSGLQALLSRAVYYQLADCATVQLRDDQAHAVISSDGCEFSLGVCE